MSHPTSCSQYLGNETAHVIPRWSQTNQNSTAFHCAVAPQNFVRKQHPMHERYRESDNIGIVALDANDPTGGNSLDRICSCFVHRFARTHVEVDVLFWNLGHSDMS